MVEQLHKDSVQDALRSEQYDLEHRQEIDSQYIGANRRYRVSHYMFGMREPRCQGRCGSQK